ncbi:hypothetical protein BS47DRAFT_1329891 [Hydnum rufescens UP504]|uniref:Phosphoglycerate mutase n=1 Tax=Hydnum rufescens UP504 TaxID=1448309 RepID=A0A9P6AW28_9AGAM|nr:hypothetical protein BS47DRAFT_1329891 [Hydnum rufescens UP504]
MKTVIVHLLRHGETAENALHIIQGQLDTQLNVNGQLQAQIIGQAMQDVPFTHAFSSDAHRAADTARAVLQYHPGVVLKPSTLLRERHMGIFQGTRVKKGWKPDSSVETKEDLLRRLMFWWQTEILSLVTSTSDVDVPAVVLVVSHGASLRTLVWDGLIPTGYARPEMTSLPHLYNTSVSSVAMVPPRNQTTHSTGRCFDMGKLRISWPIQRRWNRMQTTCKREMARHLRLRLNSILYNPPVVHRYSTLASTRKQPHS